MLLTLTDLELNLRATAFSTVLATAPEHGYSISRNRINSDVVAIKIDATDVEGLIHATSQRGEEWAGLIMRGTAFALYLSFDEVWRKIPSDKSDWRRKLVGLQSAGPAAAQQKALGKSKPLDIWMFNGLRMRFYIQAEDQALHQWLRCEWEPYEYQPQAAELSNPEATAEEKLKFALVFNGSCIAHPHFHFDSIPLSKAAKQRIKNSMPESSGFMEGLPGTAPNHLVKEFATGMIANTDSVLQHLHLPTIARWQDVDAFSLDGHHVNATTPLPHQHYPKSVTELDRWFGWCLHYFLDQFRQYVAKD